MDITQSTCSRSAAHIMPIVLQLTPELFTGTGRPLLASATERPRLRSFEPGLYLSKAPFTLAIALSCIFILIHTCSWLRPPYCDNGDESKAGLDCSLLTVLWQVQSVGKLP